MIIINTILRLLVVLRVFRTLILIQPQGELSWLNMEYKKLRWMLLKKRIILINYAEAPLTITPLCPEELVQSTLYVHCMRHELRASEFVCPDTDLKLRAIHAKNTLLQLTNFWNPLGFLLFQGFTPEAYFARQISCIRGLRLISLENTMNPRRCIMENFTGISVNFNSAIVWYYRLKDFIVSPPARNLILQINSKKSAEHTSPSSSVLDCKKSKIRVLFLGQCYTDTSLLFGTKSMPEDIIPQLNKLQAEVIIKLHPKEVSGITPLGAPYNNLTYRKIKSLVGTHITIDYENKLSTMALIQTSDVIVTINSQAGLEALALGKEVILLGKSFYDGIGCTHNITPEELTHTVERILSGYSKNDVRSVDKFIDIYFNHYCQQKTETELVNFICKAH